MKMKKKKATGKRKTKARGKVLPLIYRYVLTKLPKKTKKKKGKKKKKIQIHEESSEFEVLPDAGSVIFINPEIIGYNEDTVCLKLNRDAQAILKCVIGEDFFIDNNWKYVHKDVIKMNIKEKGEESPFYLLQEYLEVSPKKHVLVIFDKNLLAYYLFFSFSPLRHIQNLAVKLMKSITWMKRGDRRIMRTLVHFRSTKAKIIARTLIRERLTIGRTRIRVICFDYFEAMGLREHNLSSVEAKDLEGGYMNNLMRKTRSEEEMKDVVPVKTGSSDESGSDDDEDDNDWSWGVRDFNVQALPRIYKIFAQTFPSGILNKSTQRRFARLMSRRRIFRTYGKALLVSDACTKLLSRNLEENEIQNLCADFNGGYKGVATRQKSFVKYSHLLEPFDFMGHHTQGIAAIARQRSVVTLEYERFENVSCMAWHPTFIDIVAVTHRGFICYDRELYYYEDDFDELEDLVFERENYLLQEIIEWKITDETPKAMRIIYSDCEIRHLQYNVDYPTLLAGANTRGQILVWDMNIYSVPETIFISYMSSLFSSEVVPWIYTRPPIFYITIESCDVFSHLDDIHDMQWIPSNSLMLNDGTVDISGEIRSGVIVTASGDGTIGLWNFAYPHPNTKYDLCLQRRVSMVFPDVPPFDQYDRHFQPAQFVLSTLNGDPVPVTAVSVNNMRQWVIPGIEETDYFNYESMRNALKKQRPMMHACITAGLVNGQIIGMLPDLQNYELMRGLSLPEFIKDLYFVPDSDQHMHYQCFKHEGMVLCLKRSHFADDLMLSVSAESFCIWKEQSKLYRERRKKMPWLQISYTDRIHGPPVNPRILPLWWKRVHRAGDWYMNGEWSPLRASQFFLLVSTGEVEIYDVNINEEPILTVYIGNNVINQVLPLVCSTRVDEIAFIEDEAFYFCKMPGACKYKNVSLIKNLTKFATNGAWRRYFYTYWCEIMSEQCAEYVKRRMAAIQATIDRRRLERITRVFELVRLRKAKARKAMIELSKDLYYDYVPADWWNDYKRRGIQGFLKRKKDFMNWIEWEDVIDDLTDREIFLFEKLFGPHKFAYKPLERYKKERIELKLNNACLEFFQLYWDKRYEQQHMYDHLFAEDIDEDSAYAETVDTRSVETKLGAPDRKKNFGVIFEFIDLYESDKVRDLGIKKLRREGWRLRPVEVLACDTMFSHYMNDVHTKKLTGIFPKITHESNIRDAAPPLNMVCELLEVWERTGPVPMFFPGGVERRRGAIDVTYEYD